MSYPRTTTCGLTGIVKVVYSAEEEREFHRDGARALVGGFGIALVLALLLLLTGCTGVQVNFYSTDGAAASYCRDVALDRDRAEVKP